LWIIGLSSCDKEEKTAGKIDVSTQWNIDPIGVIISAPDTGQWNRKIFTDTELSLFTSLDTVNLAGSTTPVMVRDTLNYAFPNPFSNYHILTFKFNDNFSGEVVIKYVIVDSRLNAVDKKVGRVNSNSGYGAVSMAPDLSPGQYRLYYTLSSQANPHFYQSWGNIEKQ
jgi:hypothetical protein